MVSASLTILFEDPFWIGILERYENDVMTVSKITFGAEPKDSEVYAYMLRHYENLPMSPGIPSRYKREAVNPKRRSRAIHRQLSPGRVGTKSQEAIKLMQSQNKLVRRKKSREEQLSEEKRLFQMRQQKKKEKHKGH